MEVYSIEELHNLIINKEIDLNKYYEELFEEATLQQERLNAFVTITKDEALKNIKELDVKEDELLKGIPAVFKDNYNTKGIKTTASSKMLEDYVPVYNATVVEKLYNQGISLVGKASMDELAMGGTNKSALTGPVFNPWDSSRIAGGSSGGSAALVGCGLVPFALGSDTGDSIRKPAGFCGVVGFKPTNRPVPHYLKDLNSDIKGIKIAVLKTVSDEIRNEDIKNNFVHVVNTFKQLGAIVEEVEIPNHLARAILPTYTIIANSEATSNHSCLDGIKYGDRQPGNSTDEVMINSRTDGFGAHIKRRFILGNLALATENQEKMFRKAQRVRRLIVAELNKIYQDYDIILTPNGGSVAPKLDDANDDRLSDEYIILENHLALGNFAGTPSLSLPSGFSEGMPIAVNLMGRLFEEQTVFNVAYALEQALGFANQYSRKG